MKASRKREIASLRTLENSVLSAYTKKSKIKWFYAFVPFKISTGGTSTLIPLLTLEASGSPQEVGVINAIGSIASMIGGTFWGRLSDKTLKRKPFLMLGFIGTSLFSFLMAFSRDITHLMILNFLYSFFIAATIPIPVILIARVLKKKQLNYGIAKFNEIGGWAWVVGLILGFFLAYFLNIRQLLVVFALVNIFSIVLGVKWIQEVPFRIERKNLGVYANYIVEKFRYLPNIMIHLPDYNKRAFTRFLEFKEFYLASILLWIGAMLYFSQFPVLLKSRNISTPEIYLAAVLNSSISAYMYMKAGIHTERMGGKASLIRGLSIRSFGFSLILLGLSQTGMVFKLYAFASYALAGYSWAYIGISTTSIISKLAKEREQGAMMGFYNLISSLGAIIGSTLSGIIVNSRGFFVDFLFASLLILLSIFIVWKFNANVSSHHKV
ncbi:hypothetical protein ADU37_CDS10410 [Thermococcus sp. 2319x1]|uniref:MFS transporter n=1 Tax=Thermococcus sp. 2319x1 TaxID=1674923 RepID=UPI00073ACCF6|nr:MFS transporter [Thermococcus sp. 2319x1]ALV62740.1 hypothetical protein ADU37_CDS10410 [Thermococcus sp. 2319x1]